MYIRNERKKARTANRGSNGPGESGGDVEVWGGREPPNPEETAWIVARDLPDVARELASLNGMARPLKGADYATLRFRMEAAHAAVEAALIEARRRVRINEEWE